MKTVIWATTSSLIILPLVDTASESNVYAVVHHPTSTKNGAAQRCFDRGLTLFYGYNRVASQRAFECAAKNDPTFAMAYWGIALACGANINFQVDAVREKTAFAAVHRAIVLEGNASSEERAYIAALAARYSSLSNPNLRALALAYSKSMGTLVAQYPDDIDAAALYAESLMELRPWQWYTPAGKPVGETNAIVATLESILTREPQHIGANHFYIHMMEASVHPERALMSAARLRNMNFEPGAAHLVHMPAHIYMRTGDYASAAEVNEHASMHDVEYHHETHEDQEASIYHDHNLTMLAAAYGNEGRWTDAKRVAALLSGDGAQVPAMFVYLRFNRWNDILKMSKPRADSSEPIRISMWHFVRGMALAATAKLHSAELELAAVREARRVLRFPSSPGWYNSSSDIFGIASNVLTARIMAAQGKRSSQISFLRSAVAIQDNMLYIEPPDWYAPVRESLGAALFSAGDYSMAAQVFREDLRRNARNPRSLFGLYRSLNARAKSADASWVLHQFNTAWNNADVALAMSDL